MKVKEERSRSRERKPKEERSRSRSDLIFIIFFSSFSDLDPAIYLGAAPDPAPGFAISMDVKTSFLHKFIFFYLFAYLSNFVSS